MGDGAVVVRVDDDDEIAGGLVLANMAWARNFSIFNNSFCRSLH